MYKYKYCIIAGIPGIGKTTLAEIVLWQHIAKGWKPVVVTSDIKDALAAYRPQLPQIFYYDDFLGQASFGDKLAKNEDDSLLRLIDAISHSPNKLLILTTREYILSQAKATYEKLARSGFDIHKCVIELDDYTRFDKALILYNHLHFYDVAPVYIEELVKKGLHRDIISHQNYNPRIIEWMTTRLHSNELTAQEYCGRFIEMLDHPIEIWSHAFDNQISQISRCLLLVLATLPDNVERHELLEAFNAFWKVIVERHGLSREWGAFDRALAELDNNFIQNHRSGSYIYSSFHNPSVLDFLRDRILASPEIVEDLVASAVYFEQIVKLDKLLAQTGGLKQHLAMKEQSGVLAAAVTRVFRSRSAGSWVYSGIKVNIDTSPEERLVALTEMLGESTSPALLNVLVCIFDQVVNEAAASGKPDIENLASAIVAAKDTSLFKDSRFHGWVELLKKRTESLENISFFWGIGKVMAEMTEFFKDSEVSKTRDRFVDFTQAGAIDFVEDSSDPMEVEEFGEKLKDTAGFFEVNVRKELDFIETRVAKLESAADEGPDVDDDYSERTWSKMDESHRQEKEIDSMFESLLE